MTLDCTRFLAQPASDVYHGDMKRWTPESLAIHGLRIVIPFENEHAEKINNALREYMALARTFALFVHVRKCIVMHNNPEEENLVYLDDYTIRMMSEALPAFTNRISEDTTELHVYDTMYNNNMSSWANHFTKVDVFGIETEYDEHNNLLHMVSHGARYVYSNLFSEDGMYTMSRLLSIQGNSLIGGMFGFMENPDIYHKFSMKKNARLPSLRCLYFGRRSNTPFGVHVLEDENFIPDFKHEDAYHMTLSPKFLKTILKCAPNLSTISGRVGVGVDNIEKDYDDIEYIFSRVPELKACMYASMYQLLANPIKWPDACAHMGMFVIELDDDADEEEIWKQVHKTGLCPTDEIRFLYGHAKMIPQMLSYAGTLPNLKVIGSWSMTHNTDDDDSMVDVVCNAVKANFNKTNVVDWCSSDNCLTQLFDKCNESLQKDGWEFRFI